MEPVEILRKMVLFPAEKKGAWGNSICKESVLKGRHVLEDLKRLCKGEKGKIQGGNSILSFKDLCKIKAWMDV